VERNWEIGEFVVKRGCEAVKLRLTVKSEAVKARLTGEERGCERVKRD
jgi:hypothetical protein